ncbi:hypothetical protein Pla144_34050 [Bythopirellula polymerisocia]|uniref:Uncharacterized protein n=1 Tax=Bythopirellula polymerisocia TaxID=2528003 RepID=A0A5C6CMG7_9BACT|nr:hypothetical protein Pla144_34050 [Bythopirellula polymerisocia]
MYRRITIFHYNQRFAQLRELRGYFSHATFIAVFDLITAVCDTCHMKPSTVRLGLCFRTNPMRKRTDAQ